MTRRPRTMELLANADQMLLAKAIFYQEIAARGLLEIHAGSWRSEAPLGAVMDAEGVELLFAQDWALRNVLVVEARDVLILVDQGHDRSIDIEVAGKQGFDSEAIREWLLELLPPAKYEAGDIALDFWMQAPHGPQSITRRITTPKWSSIRENYSRAAREGVEVLLHPDFRPSAGGQLLLWHGEPGTGKTYAIRAMLNSWERWCGAIYVTDPEEFFGHAAYMLHVLLGSVSDQTRWRLVVIEDAGELLATDARDRTGQGLSRLLNVSDGIIGQGLRVIFLITTNEELGALHPAVSRPGRCLSELKFDKLSSSETGEWLRARGVDGEIPDQRMSIAEAYAFLEQGSRLNRGRPRLPVGFMS